MSKRKITTEKALEVFKNATLESVGEEMVVLKYEGVDIYYDRGTMRYDGMGRWVGTEQAFKLPQRKRAS